MTKNEGFNIVELPIYDGDSTVEKSAISRFINHKGELAVLSISELNYIAYLNFLLNDSVRGNHCHFKKLEYIYLCRGKILGHFKKYDEDSIFTVEIKEGSLTTCTKKSPTSKLPCSRSESVGGG